MAHPVAGQAKTQLAIDQRHIHHALHFGGVVIAIPQGDVGGGGVQPGPGAEQVEGAAGGAAPIESGLRPAQNLDALQVIELGSVDGGYGVVNVIKVEGDAILAVAGDYLGADATDREVGTGEIVLAEVDARRGELDVAHAFKAAGGDIIGREGTDRHRHGLQIFPPMLGGDADGFDALRQGRD